MRSRWSPWFGFIALVLGLVVALVFGITLSRDKKKRRSLDLQSVFHHENFTSEEAKDADSGAAKLRKRQRSLPKELTDLLQRFNKKEHRIFPFRYFTDEKGNVLPIVAVTAFFRGKEHEELFREYIKKGVKVFGITAFKSFPNRAMMDKSEGDYERNDTFDYVSEIRDWLSCFRNRTSYGFSDWNRTIDMSESDFYNVENKELEVKKKYDFIYICNKDSDDCPLEGWNAFNRNFKLAKKCFPIMCREFKLKGLVVGRDGCGLENEYDQDELEVVGWLDWNQLQEKMRESKFLFVPNVFDASPRVIAECITKGLSVLMNKDILCGFKYVTDATGEFFTNEIDIRSALNLLRKRRRNTHNIKKWWAKHYSQEKSQTGLRNFLEYCYPGLLSNVKFVRFIL